MSDLGTIAGDVGTIASFIPGGQVVGGVLGALGGLFGGSGPSAAQKAASAQAGKDQAAARTGYGAVGAQGQQNTSLYNQNFSNLFGQFQQNAGLNQGQSNTVPNMQAGQGAPRDQQFQRQQVDLSHDEQQRLSQSVDSVHQAAQTATADYQAQLSRAGITDPRYAQAGLQAINEHFTALAQKTQTDFMFQAQQAKQQALQQALSLMSNVGQQGTSEQLSAAGGMAGLGGAAQAQGNVQQNRDDSQNNALKQLFGFAAGGGFGQQRQNTNPYGSPVGPVSIPTTYGPGYDKGGYPTENGVPL